MQQQRSHPKTTSKRCGRCLIPATNYYEWLHRDGKATKEKYAIKEQGDGMIHMAGLYRHEEGEEFPVFTIITREPAPGIAFVHNRMPMIPGKEAAREWMRGGESVDYERVFAESDNDMVYEEVV